MLLQVSMLLSYVDVVETCDIHYKKAIILMTRLHCTEVLDWKPVSLPIFFNVGSQLSDFFSPTWYITRSAEYSESSNLFNGGV